MGRAVFCIIFDGEFDFSNNIAWGGPGMLSTRDIWTILWGQMLYFLENNNLYILRFRDYEFIILRVLRAPPSALQRVIQVIFCRLAVYRRPRVSMPRACRCGALSVRVASPTVRGSLSCRA